MATQFVHSNNQSLLWKVINNTPQTINYFANAPHGEKEKWFQTIIGHVYNQYNGQNISLRDINKRAIDFMLQSLQVQQVQSSAQSATQSATQSAQVPYQVPLQSAQVPLQSAQVPLQSAQVPLQSAQVPLQSAQVPYKSREQQLTDQFTRRQAEYESMVKKDVPTPHFTENVKDEAILDLGSAVKEYMKQRDQDIEIPKPIDSPTNALHTASHKALQSPTNASHKALQSPTNALHMALQSHSALKLDLKNAEPISLIVDELPLKKVQWGENTEHVFDNNESIAFDKNESNILIKMENNILEMKTKLEEILALLQK